MFIGLLIRFNAELLLRLKGAIAIIVEVAPLMATAISALLNIIFVVLRAAIVEIFVTLGVLVDQILSFIYTYGPMLIEAIIFLLVTLIQKTRRAIWIDSGKYYKHARYTTPKNKRSHW